MVFKKRTCSVLVALFVVLTSVSSGVACTIIAAGKNATIDGTAMITHNDDSTVANFKLFIVPEADHEAGAEREVILKDHDYPGDAQVVGKIPQVKHTYRYFKSRYSFMNENGVAIGEATNGVVVTDERSAKVKKIMETDAVGMLDAWMTQDIMLERASTAREAVEIMGKLIEEHGWFDAGETMNLTDGNEVWIIEFYGNKIWAAWRLPDDEVFVAANRARLRNLDLTDKNNVMYCPDLVDFAVANGFIEKKDVNMKNFSPADVYSPNNEVYATRREWRALSLVAPESFKMGPSEMNYPMSVKPDKKLSVDDIFKIKGDWYAGTSFDLSQGPASGPWGDPIRYANRSSENKKAAWERSINMHRTCYLHIAQVKGDLPKEIRGISWYGYGAPDTTYLTPLWPIMKALPKFYQVGSRYEEFRRDSGWWVNTYVQQMAQLHYQEARKDIHAAREPKMNALYMLTPIVQEKAAQLLKDGKRDEAINLISDFAYSNAVDWNQRWLTLGDWLLGEYAMGYKNFKTTPFPEWWNKVVGFDEPTR